jgi:hypothetical protein
MLTTTLKFSASYSRLLLQDLTPSHNNMGFTATLQRFTDDTYILYSRLLQRLTFPPDTRLPDRTLNIK